MSAVEPEYDEEGNEITQPQGESPAMKAAREAADRAADRAGKAERENALLRALPGVDLDSPLGKMFVSSYDGPLESEPIKEAAIAVALISAPEPAPDPTNATDAAAAAARADLQTGAVPPQETPDPEEVEDPNELGLRKFSEAMKAGRSAENASAEYFDRVVGAAIRGDQRAIWGGRYSDEQLAGA